MSLALDITPNEILFQIKITGQMPSIVEGIVTRKIIASKAKESGIKVTPEELQLAADNWRLMNKLQSADETWSWLRKHSCSLDDFEEIIYHNVISSKLAQYLFGDKVESFFIENHLNYTQVVMCEVILDDEDLAMELFYALSEGEVSFPEVAYQYIQDKSLRRSGGYRGALHRQDLKPEISAAIFAVNPPQVLKPIITHQGVHLILVEEIIQPELDEMLRFEIISELFAEWLNQQSQVRS